jgi:ATP-dependent DNA ligase
MAEKAALDLDGSFFVRFSFVFPVAIRPHPTYMRLPQMDPAKLSLVRQPFNNPDFPFELKHDGFRALAYISDKHCELISRQRNSYKSFGELRRHLAQLRVKKRSNRR